MTQPQPGASVPVAITGMGMLTAVGSNTAQTVTSVLAGLNRFRSWPFLGMDFGEESEGLPVASAISAFGDLTWVEKAEDLATPPLREALYDAALYSAADLVSAYGREKLVAFIATPYADREGVDESGVSTFMAEAAEHCIVDLSAVDVSFESCGQAGGLIGLGRALRDLSALDADVCVVGGIDSLLETRYLEQSIAREKIKLDTTADGLIPGEGAAFLVLERLADATRRGARIRALVGAVATASEPIPYDGTQPLEATGLNEALLGILDHADPDDLAVSDVLVDLNGERGRFQEWAIAEGRSLHRLPYGWRLHHPASSLGDLGAAMGPVLAGVAAGMLEMGRARGRAALVCASSERGERACALIGAPTLAVQ